MPLSACLCVGLLAKECWRHITSIKDDIYRQQCIYIITKCMHAHDNYIIDNLFSWEKPHQPVRLVYPEGPAGHK